MSIYRILDKINRIYNCLTGIGWHTCGLMTGQAVYLGDITSALGRLIADCPKY